MSKGQIEQSSIPFLKIFQVLMILVVSLLFLNALNTAFSSSSVFTAIMAKIISAIGVADYAMPLLFLLLVAFNIFSGAQVSTKNIYLILSLVSFVISLPIVAAINNIIDYIVTSTSGLSFSSFPITLWILDHMFVMYIVVAFSWAIGFYVKKDSPSQRGGGAYFG